MAYLMNFLHRKLAKLKYRVFLTISKNTGAIGAKLL
jgi:hypothetical protein